MLSADQEWENFLKDDTLQESKDEMKETVTSFIPKVTPIYISTQTKILPRKHPRPNIGPRILARAEKVAPR